ncbi:MAG: LysM peptidoglycan-binding domain-containing protein [Flavobacteriales bacterium]
MKNLFVLFFLIAFSFPAFSQVKDTLIDNKPYIIHTVQFQETLYGISRDYNTELNDIVVANPTVINGLLKGYKLLVPIKKSFYKKFLKSKNNEKTEHIVELNSQLITDSNNIKSNLESNVNDTLVKQNSFNIFEKDSTVNVSLLLPFYLDLNDSLSLESSTSIYNKSKIAIDFYHGALLALDSLARMGLNINCNFFDVPNDSIFEHLLLNNSLDDNDIIIGPLYVDQFHLLAEYYKGEQSIKLVSPLSFRKVKPIYNNTYQVVPTENNQISFVVDFLNSNYNEQNLVIIGSDSENELVEYTYEKIKAKRIVKNILPKPKVLIFDDENRPTKEKIKPLLTDNNIVLITSNKRSFVSRVLPFLSSMTDTTFNVYGLNTWEMFDNLDVEDLNYLKTTIPLIDSKIEGEFSENFIRKYFENYHTYASKYSLEGYKQLLFFNSKEFEFLYEFENENNSKGFNNKSIKLVRYEDYKRLKINQ